MNNQNITFRVSLLANDQNGDIVYQETHFITTSTYGGFSLSIGRGNVQEATFEDLDWSSNSYNLKIEFDANDGSGFDELGTSEILSVPYALYSMASSTVIMPLEISYDKINVSCNGGSNGHINLDISGGHPPYSIEWITGETSAFIENLSAGNYSVAVTDSDGFISTKSIVIEEPVEEEVVDEVFTIVEQQPEFPGGRDAIYQYIQKKFKYPSQAKRMGIEGRVSVQFVVDKSGNITEVQAVRGIGAGCDEEAVRIIKSMPKWKAGKHRGKAVKVKMILHIVFELN